MTIPSVPQRLLCPGSSNHAAKGEIKTEKRKRKEVNMARKRGVIKGASTFDFRLRLPAYEGSYFSFLFFFGEKWTNHFRKRNFRDFIESMFLEMKDEKNRMKGLGRWNFD